MISLSDAKLHCRIDHDEEDALIEALILAAEDFVSSQTGLDFSEDADPAPPPRARPLILLIVGDLYANRTAGAENPIKTNHATRLLMTSLRRHSLNVGPLPDEPETGE